VQKNCIPNIPIHLFLIRGAKIDNTFILKLITQGLLWLYNKNLASNLIKIKTLLMASTNKITLNVDSQTKHSTLNILVQQTLWNV
jgi:hypothetical protein